MLLSIILILCSAPTTSEPQLSTSAALANLSQLRLFRNMKPSFERFLQEPLHPTQFPMHCSSQSINMPRGWPQAGLGSEIHTIAHTVSMAWQEGNTTVLPPNGSGRLHGSSVRGSASPRMTACLSASATVPHGPGSTKGPPTCTRSFAFSTSIRSMHRPQTWRQ